MKRTFFCLAVLLGSLAGGFVCPQPARGEATDEAPQATDQAGGCPYSTQFPCDPRFDPTYDSSYVGVVQDEPQPQDAAAQPVKSYECEAFYYGQDYYGQDYDSDDYGQYEQHGWETDPERVAADPAVEACSETETAIAAPEPADQATTEDLIGDCPREWEDEYGYEYGYRYGDGYPYGDASEYGPKYSGSPYSTEPSVDEPADEAEQSDEMVDAAMEPAPANAWESEYGYNPYGDECLYEDSSAEPVAADDQLAEESSSSQQDAMPAWEDDYGYGYGYGYDYAAEYGYEEYADDYGCAEDACQDIVTESTYESAEEYRYGGDSEEYSDEYRYWEDGSEYGYDTYEYDYSHGEDAGGYAEAAVEVVDEESGQEIGESPAATEIVQPVDRNAVLALARVLDQTGSALKSLSRQLSDLAAHEVADGSDAKSVLQR